MPNFITDKELIEFAIQAKGLTCVRLANHLDTFLNKKDSDIHDHIVKKIDEFVDIWFDGRNSVKTLLRADFYIGDGIVTFDSPEFATKFFEIFNERGMTYASGAYAELYIDGKPIDVNT